MSSNTTLVPYGTPLPGAPSESQSSAGLECLAPADRESIAYFLEASMALNTRLAYQSDLRAYLSWGGTLPASPAQLASYLAGQAAVLSPYTLRRRLSALSKAHKALDKDDPTKHEVVRGVMRGIWRRVGRAQTPARPLLHQELAVIVEAGTGLRGARDRAVLLVGFKAALRRSELVGLNVEDIGFCEQGVLITVRRSKTDQEGYGRTIAVPTSKRGPCAVAALRQWLAASELSTGALFRSLVGTARLGGRLPAASVTAILRRYAAEAGLELTNLSAHSLRAGFVTSAAKAGSGVHSIQRQTGHKSIEMVFRYVRSSNLFAGNANDDFDD